MPYSAMNPHLLDFKSVQLEPFVHQVGGHSGFFHINNETLCKPLVDREHFFYENLPANLKEFIPEYRGEIVVQMIEDTDGYVTLVGYPTEYSSGILNSKKCSSCTYNSNSPTMDSMCDTSADKVSCLENQHANSNSLDPHRHRPLQSRIIEDTTKSEQQSPTEEHDAIGGINPWSLKCHKQTLSRMKKNTGLNSYKFILLENVAAQFYFPCILDLKMGTRQHGDDATEEKKKRHTRKCQSTTSSSIGVRVCGMQVHQVDTGRYICHNKYYGRSLTVEGFKLELLQFLHNGCTSRIDLVTPIIHRLLKLQDAIERRDSFRFYSSSLLIMYEGSTSLVNEASLQAINKDDPKNHSVSVSSENIDVRMIDFAHSTHQGFSGDKTVHKGPDKGYLFGLKNLVQAFIDIKKWYSENETSRP